jgi:hypothetical protein
LGGFVHISEGKGKKVKKRRKGFLQWNYMYIFKGTDCRGSNGEISENYRRYGDNWILFWIHQKVQYFQSCESDQRISLERLFSQWEVSIYAGTNVDEETLVNIFAWRHPARFSQKSHKAYKLIALRQDNCHFSCGY